MRKISLAELWLAFIWFLSVLGQWQRWESPLGRISMHEVFLLLFIITIIWQEKTRWFQVWNNKKVWLGLILIVWLGLVTVINAQVHANNTILLVGFAYLARLVLYIGFWASLTVWLLAKPSKAKLVQQGVMAWLIAQMGLGFYQYLFVPDTRLLVYLGWDDHLNRAMGTLLDPGFFGLMMVFGALLSFDFYLKQSQKSPFSWWALALAGFVLMVALSFSRASFVAYVVGFLVYAYLQRQRTIWLAIPLLILALIFIPKDGGGEGQKLLRTNSVAARKEVITYHAAEFKGVDWLIGKGWYYEGALQLHRQALGAEIEETRSSSHAQAVDNTFLHVLLSAGLPGGVLFGGYVLTLLYFIRSEPVAEAGVAAVIVHSLFSTALLYPWVLLVGGSLLIAFLVGKQPSPQPKSH